MPGKKVSEEATTVVTAVVAWPLTGRSPELQQVQACPVGTGGGFVAVPVAENRSLLTSTPACSRSQVSAVMPSARISCFLTLLLGVLGNCPQMRT